MSKSSLQLTVGLKKLSGVVIPEKTVSFLQRVKIFRGDTNWVNPNITEENFPLTVQSGPRETELAIFTGGATSMSVVTEWVSLNRYQFGRIDDLLAIGSHPMYSQWYEIDRIVVAGSRCMMHGGFAVPYLSGKIEKRTMPLMELSGCNPTIALLLIKKQRA